MSDEIVATESAPAAPVAPAATESAPAPEPKISSMADAFKAAKDEIAAKNAPPVKAETEATAETPPATEAKPDVVETPPLEAPKRWTPERKELFAKQPREIQEAMITLGKEWETGYSKKFADLAAERKLAENVREVFTPEIRAQMTRAGLDEVGSIRQLVQMQQSFMADPVRHIQALIKHAGIDPSAVLNSGPAPAVDPLVEEVKELKRLVLTERETKEAKAHEDAILEFAGMTDATGAPAFPHIERVANEMAEIILNDPRFNRMASTREKLENAYHMAVLGNPELRAELVAAEARKSAPAIPQPSEPSDRLLSAATVKPSKPGSHAPAREVTDLRSAWQSARKELGRR